MSGEGSIELRKKVIGSLVKGGNVNMLDNRLKRETDATGWTPERKGLAIKKAAANKVKRERRFFHSRGKITADEAMSSKNPSLVDDIREAAEEAGASDL